MGGNEVSEAECDPKNDLGGGQDTNRKQWMTLKEEELLMSTRGTLPVLSDLSVCSQAAHLPLGMEEGYCNSGMRKEEMDVCLEQGISQSSQAKLVLGRRWLGF